MQLASLGGPGAKVKAPLFTQEASSSSEAPSPGAHPGAGPRS